MIPTKGLRSTALIGSSLFTLAACDCGYNAGYLAGMAKTTEPTLASIEPAPAAEIATAPLFVPAKDTRSTSKGSLTRMRDRAPPTIKRLAPPAASTTASATTGEGRTTASAETTSTSSEGGATSTTTRTVVVTQPFAPLRPGSGGGGAIIRVGNGGNPPGTNPPGTNPPGTNPPGTTPPGILDPIVDPIVTPILGGATDLAKITIIDTKLLGGAPNNSQLIGAGVGSAAPVVGQLASVNVLPQNGSSLAGVDVVRGDVASIAVLPGAQGAAGRPVDSLAAIAVGNAPILSGGQSPLVSVSALPSLPVVGGILAPVTGAPTTPGTPTTPTTPSTPALPALPVLGGGAGVDAGLAAGLGAGLGATVGNLTAGLGLGAGAGIIGGIMTAPPAGN